MQRRVFERRNGYAAEGHADHDGWVDCWRSDRAGPLPRATFTFGADVVNKQGAGSHLDGRWTLILEQRKGG